MYMLSVISSIFLIFALQHSALSGEANWLKKEIQKELENSTKISSEKYANIAIEGYQKKLGTPAEHIALIEKSLFKNPYRYSLYKLRSQILTEQSYSSFEIPSSLHLMTAFKPLFTFLVFLIFLILGARFTGKLYNHRVNYTKPEENLGFYCLSSLLMSALFFSLFLWHYNKVHQPWACVTSKSATVYSGPSVDSVIVRSLPSGACIPMQRRLGDWAGFSTARVSGWVDLKHLESVRGR
jgi:hypothetical protein